MNESNPSASRRRFLQAAGAVAAVAAVSAPRVARGANEKLGVGFIGCGGRSGAHLSMVRHLRDKSNYPVDLVAACDVYRPRLERAAHAFNIPRQYMDYRDLLADPNVDVVAIATPDHWHAQQAIDAAKAGKAIYCEKPITHWSQFDKLKELHATIQSTKVAFQLGTQGMSDPVWRLMKKLVREGLIGQPVFGETSFFRIGDFGERGMRIDDPNAKPGPDLDWNAWLGDRPNTDFNVDRLFRWRLFEEYAGGPVTDLYPHCATQIVDILGVGMPETVVAVGGIDRYNDELRTVPDTFSLLAHYEQGVTLSVLGTQANDFSSIEGYRGAGRRLPYIRGWGGSLIIRDNREVVFIPVRQHGAKPAQTFPIEGGEDNLHHWQNLLDAHRANSQDTWSPIDLAYRTQAAMIMAMLSYKQRRVYGYDPSAERLAALG